MIDWLDELPSWTGFLRAHGFRLSVGDDLLLTCLVNRLRVSNVQVQDAEAVARWLGPAFCRNADDQAHLPILLREWAQALELVVVNSDSSRIDEPETLRRWIFDRIPRLALLVAALVALAFSAWAWLHHGSSSEIPLKPVTNGVQNVSFVKEGSSWIGEISSHVILSALLGYSAFVVIFLAVLAWSSNRRRKAALFRGLAPRDARAQALKIATPEFKLFRVAAMRSTFSELRRHRKVEADWIDPNATVAATIAASGFIKIVRGKRLELPEHLLLVDLANAEDIFGTVADLITNRLREGDVPFERFEFRGDPRRLRCTGPRAGSSITLEALQAERPNARIFVLSDAGGFGLPGSERLRRWVDELQAWNDVALLTPLPPQQWGLRERTLIKRGFLVVQATPDGIAILARLLQTGTSVESATPGGSRAAPLDMRIAANPFAWLGESAPEPPQITSLLDDIQTVIDQRTMLYFTALSVFPALHPNLTLLVGSLLAADDGQPVLDELSLAQLCRLPWLRQGRIPDWLRLALVRRLQERPKEEARVLAVWTHLLEPRPDVLDAGSITSLETMRLMNPTVPKLVAELIRRRPVAFKEAILLSFLNGKRLPELAIELPERLVQTINEPQVSFRKLTKILETWTARQEKVRAKFNNDAATSVSKLKDYAKESLLPTRVEQDATDQPAMTGIETSGLQFSQLPPLSPEDIKVIRNSWVGKILGRTGVVLSLVSMLLGFGVFVNKGLSDLLNERLILTPLQKFALFFGIPGIYVASQVYIEIRSILNRRADKSSVADDTAALHKMGYAQELYRSMGGFSNFAISFSVICILVDFH